MPSRRGTGGQLLSVRGYTDMVEEALNIVLRHVIYFTRVAFVCLFVRLIKSSPVTHACVSE